VVKDAELAEALAASRDLLGERERRSEAGQVRRLAILGAQALLARNPVVLDDRVRRRLLDFPGSRPAIAHFEDLPWLDEPVDESHALSADLDWARGER